MRREQIKEEAEDQESLLTAKQRRQSNINNPLTAVPEDDVFAHHPPLQAV